MLKKMFKRIMVLSLSLSMVFTNLTVVSAKQEKNVNLALEKPVTASLEYSSMPASNLTDNDKNSRWSTEQNATQWAYVDLGKTCEMNYFSIIWENNENYAKKYNIYVSDDNKNWGEAVVKQENNTKQHSEETLETPVRGRYVKLEITEVSNYPSVSARDFTIMNKDESVQDPTENVALHKNAVSSSNEADTLGANKATDGDTTSRESRWASQVGVAPHWIYVDLGSTMDVKTVRVFWETRKPTNYSIQLSDDSVKWETVKTIEDHPKSKKDDIVLDQTKKARYVKLLIDAFDAKDPDSDGKWNNVSIHELEVYGGTPKVDPIESITVQKPNKGDKKLVVNIPEVEGYKIAYNGTDYEQIVDKDLTIYQPVVDTTVNVSFKVTNERTGKYQFKEVPVVVPGEYNVQTSDNKAPTVIPELREWKGHSGTFAINNLSRIVYKDAKLKDVANTFAADYKKIVGKDITVVNADKANAGDIFFTLTTDKSLGLKDEGYKMEVADQVKVTAEDPTGAYWATRTILQSFKSSNNTINKGIARDYPLYKVRGFILDAGRKTFTMDYLKKVVEMMSWYKMNDFQVHLNDNLIPLEHYNQIGKNPMDAYSGFRLESNIKKGGNNGLNKADLTSKDVFYTKNEFRDFIKESRVRGVEIVPEIDTPAHSLALTKVRPDLRHGTYGRENDHLNLTSKYNDSLSFVKSIFNEYMGKDLDNPVFDENTTIHIGADEYSADGDAYRRFCNDMMKYVEDSNRTSRIWGSLSSIKGSGNVPVRGDTYLNQSGRRVQMNLWNYGWANIDKMYDLGFDLINCNDGHYYIVPNAGYYYDYLNNDILYNLPINSIGGFTVPAGDEQMIGGAFAVWNDMMDYLDNGVSEWDVYDRIKNAVPLFGAKLWGKQDKSKEQVLSDANTLGDGPKNDFNYTAEADKDGVIGQQLMKSDDAIELKGGNDFVETKLPTVGLGNDLRVKVKRTSNSKDEQVLFESSYGSIKAVQKETGKVGFTRENYNYSFNYELPINDWVELEFKNVKNQFSLYVNGKLVDTIGDNDRINGRPLLATMMLPVERIGSKTNSFIGFVDDVRVGISANYNSTMKLDYAVQKAEVLLAKKDNTQLRKLINDAKAIFNKFAPTEKEITECTNSINNIIKTIDYKKADYSRVDAYIALTDDLSIYTEESVKVVRQVIDSIRRDLPIENQGIVDEYERLLAQAISNLKLVEKTNVNFIDNSKLNATASSQQSGGEGAPKVLDGQNGSIWHSKYDLNKPTDHHWLQINFNDKVKVEKVRGITYVPRQSGTNGNLLEYVIKGSNDNKTFTEIKTGTLDDNNKPKEITFDPVTYKHIRIEFKRSEGNFASAAEIMLHTDVKADKDGLKEVIDSVKATVNHGYTEESWTALQNKIKEAEALYNKSDADANDVELMKSALINSKLSLVLKAKKGQLFVEGDEKTQTILEESLTGKLKDTVNDYLEKGKDITIKVVNTVLDMNSESNKDVLAKFNAFINTNLKGYKVASMSDINVQVLDGKELLGNISKTKGKLTLSMNVPEELDQEGRTFTILSLVNGKVEKIKAVKDGNKLVFETDVLGKYAVVYSDDSSNKPDTGKPWEDLTPSKPIEKPDNGKPWEDLTPAKPVVPVKPEQPDNEKVENEEKPNTGVSTNTALLWAVVIGAGAAVTLLANKKRKEQK